MQAYVLLVVVKVRCCGNGYAIGSGLCITVIVVIGILQSAAYLDIACPWIPKNSLQWSGPSAMDCDDGDDNKTMGYAPSST